MAAPREVAAAAATNRSLRTVRTELEFLCDSQVITPHHLASLLSQLPNQTVLHAPISSPDLRSTDPNALPESIPAVSSPPVAQIANRLNAASLGRTSPNFNATNTSQPQSAIETSSLNEKQSFLQNQNTPAPPSAPTSSSPLPPPAYATSQSVPIATASALYEYHPSDAGDLAILPSDRVMVTEFMNADWAKGRNERTGLEGIFPRSYVTIVNDSKSASPAVSRYGYPPPPPPMPMSGPHPGTPYGNLPYETTHSTSSSTLYPAPPNSTSSSMQNKFGENGKKFGKKMGNAAIFGAGATLGSNIVNSIL